MPLPHIWVKRSQCRETIYAKFRQAALFEFTVSGGASHPFQERELEGTGTGGLCQAPNSAQCHCNLVPVSPNIELFLYLLQNYYEALYKPVSGLVLR